MKTQPTPGPWEVSKTGTLPIYIRSPHQTWKTHKFTYVAEIALNAASPDSFEEQIANAEHIVRCVNAASKAIAALEGLLKQRFERPIAPVLRQELAAIIDEAREVIAELKGE